MGDSLVKNNIIILIVFLFTAFFFIGAVSATSNESYTTTPKMHSSTFQYKDLVVTSVSGPIITSRGQGISIKHTVYNNGNSAINNGFYTNFYLVSTKSFSGSKTYIGRQYISSLPAWKSIIKSTHLTFPKIINYGSYYILAKVDATNTIHELNENNNIRYSTKKTAIYPLIDSGSIKFYSDQLGGYHSFYWKTYQYTNGFVYIDGLALNPHSNGPQWWSVPLHYTISKISSGTLQINFVDPMLVPYTGMNTIVNFRDTHMTAAQYYWNILNPGLRKYGDSEPETFDNNLYSA